jgi:hypothetical protein
VPDALSGMELVVEPGDHLYTSKTGFGGTLTPGTYTFQWREWVGDKDEGGWVDLTQDVNKFTIGYCIPKPPTTVCGGSVTFPDQITGYTIDIFQPAPDAPAIIRPNAVSFQVTADVPFGPITLVPGVYGYQWFVGDPNGDGIRVGDTGTITIVACPPSPTPTPTGVAAHPSTTPPPTSTGSTGSGSGSAPILPLMIMLGFAALGLVAVQSQRKARI